MRDFRLILLLLLAWSNSLPTAHATGDEANHISLTQEQIRAFGLQTATVARTDMSPGFSYPAEVVVPSTQLQIISALQGGLLETLLVAEGDSVTKGQTVARIKSPALLEQQRDLLQTLIQLNLTRANMNRDKQLLEEGIIPKRRYQESVAAWRALDTQKKQQEALLLLSGMSKEDIATLEKSRQLDSTLLISAPFDGTILKQLAIPGQKLEITDPIFKIARLSPLWLEIHVPVMAVSGLKPGDPITVPDLDIKGKIITIGKEVHAADQGTLVRALVTEHTDRLRPGQIVQALILRKGDDQQRYLIPHSAIVRIDGKQMIFIRTEKGFRALQVSVAGRRGEQTVIQSAEPIDAPVVIKGAVALKAAVTGVDEKTAD